jgi:hypothetical protein
VNVDLGEHLPRNHRDEVDSAVLNEATASAERDQTTSP